MTIRKEVTFLKAVASSPRVKLAAAAVVKGIPFLNWYSDTFFCTYSVNWTLYKFPQHHHQLIQREWERGAREEDLPVTRLAACGNELVWVKEHDLVLVVLVDKDTVNRRCICRHDSESISDKTEHALHLQICFSRDKSCFWVTSIFSDLFFSSWSMEI